MKLEKGKTKREQKKTKLATRGEADHLPDPFQDDDRDNGVMSDSLGCMLSKAEVDIRYSLVVVRHLHQRRGERALGCPALPALPALPCYLGPQGRSKRMGAPGTPGWIMGKTRLLCGRTSRTICPCCILCTVHPTTTYSTYIRSTAVAPPNDPGRLLALTLAPAPRGKVRAIRVLTKACLLL